MRWLILLLCTALTMAVFAFLFNDKIHPPKSTGARVTANFPANNKAELLRLKSYAAVSKSFTKMHHYNTNVSFLIDMKLPSGSNRFFVYDLQNDSIINTGLVTHGSGTDNSSQTIFSNKPSSYCSSLGKYKIGAGYNGKFGLAYKLYGLDSSNSNAYNRFVVLHSHSCVPEKEVSPQYICESWGCPTVAPGFLLQLKPFIDKSEKPILLEIFY